jgi:gas vesicle protein
MKLIAKRSSLLSVLLIFALLFATTNLDAAITRENMQKAVKWTTIGGIAISAAIGAATFGIGGLLIGGAVGALVSTVIWDHYGVAPRDQWKQVFPNFKMPFKYNRQNQGSGLGTSIPVSSSAQAPSANQSQTFAEKVRANYQKAYQNYTDAVQKSKDSGLIKKALDAYKKAKAEFDKLKN